VSSPLASSSTRESADPVARTVVPATVPRSARPAVQWGCTWTEECAERVGTTARDAQRREDALSAPRQVCSFLVWSARSVRKAALVVHPKEIVQLALLQVLIYTMGNVNPVAKTALSAQTLTLARSA